MMDIKLPDYWTVFSSPVSSVMEIISFKFTCIFATAFGTRGVSQVTQNRSLQNLLISLRRNR